MSSTPFVPNIEKIVAALQGDLGIADAITGASRDRIAAGVLDPDAKARFVAASAQQGRTGFKALERTTISTMMESFKPLVELALAVLELLSGAEVFLGKAFTGVNPYALAGSFSSGLADAQGKLADLRGAGLAGPASAPPRGLPSVILLGVYDRQGAPAVPTQAEGRNAYYAGPWPMLRTVEDLRKARLDALTPSLSALGEADRADMLREATGSIQEEWDYMRGEGSLFKARAIYDRKAVPLVAPLQGWLATRTIKDAAGEVEVDAEEDYLLEVFYNRLTKRHVLHAVLRPELGGPGGDGTKASGQQKRPGTSPYVPFPLKAPILLVKLVLPVVLKRIMPAIQAIQAIVNDPPGFILQLVLAKLKEHFEWLDPTIRLRGAEDALRRKYYDGDRFLLDGVGSANIGNFYITVGLKDGVPFVSNKPPEPGARVQPTLNAILGMVKMPIQILLGLIKKFTELVKRFMNPAKVAGAVKDLLTFRFLTDMLQPEGIMELLGATPGVPSSIPFFNAGAFAERVAVARQKLRDAQARYERLERKGRAVAAGVLADAQRELDTAAQFVKDAVAGAAAQVAATLRQMLLTVQETLNAVVAMPLDILNVPESIRSAIPKLALV
jgi:hypothetical protein